MSSDSRSAADRAADEAADRIMAPNPTVYFVVGVTLGLAGVGLLAWLYVVGLGGSSLEKLIPGFGAEFEYTSVPIVLFLFAGIALFFAEMFRGARWETRARGFWEGGSVAITLKKLPLWVVFLWMMLPLSVYLVLIPLPALAETSGGVFGATVRGASEEFWEMAAFYGLFAAGTLGVMLASLLKRATYARLAARYGPPPARGRRFWRVVSTQWRAEIMLSFLSAGIFAVLPWLWHDSLAGQKPFDDTALLYLTVIAGTCGFLCVGLTLNAWRSGVPYGMAESI